MRVAKVDSTVLLLGESGVGKEGIGKLLHTQSNRADGPFIKLNCGAIPEHLLVFDGLTPSRLLDIRVNI